MKEKINPHWPPVRRQHFFRATAADEAKIPSRFQQGVGFNWVDPFITVKQHCALLLWLFYFSLKMLQTTTVHDGGSAWESDGAPVWLQFRSTANSPINTHGGALGVIAINTSAANKPCFTSIILWYYQLHLTHAPTQSMWRVVMSCWETGPAVNTRVFPNRSSELSASFRNITLSL